MQISDQIVSYSLFMPIVNEKQIDVKIYSRMCMNLKRAQFFDKAHMRFLLLLVLLLLLSSLRTAIGQGVALNMKSIVFLPLSRVLQIQKKCLFECASSLGLFMFQSPKRAAKSNQKKKQQKYRQQQLLQYRLIENGRLQMQDDMNCLSR